MTRLLLGACALLLALTLGLSLRPVERPGALPPSDTSSAQGAAFQQVEKLQTQAAARRGQGDSGAAAAALADAGVILQGLRERTPFDPDVLKYLGINAYWLGQLSKDRSDLDGAAIHWQDYLESASRLSRLQPANVDWWIERSYALNNLGSLAVTRADWKRAALAFDESIVLKRRALEARPDDSTLMSELADSYSWLGLAREALGELAAAEALYAQEMAVVARLRVQMPDERAWIEHEMRALQRRAALSLVRGRDADALADYRRAAHALAGLSGFDPENRSWQIEQAGLELKIEMILIREVSPADVDEATALVSRIAAIHARLDRLHRLDAGQRWWSQTEAVVRTRLGLALLRGGRLSEAKRHARAAVARLEALVAGAPDNVNLRLATVGALLLLGETEGALHHEAGAHQACRQARGLIHEANTGTLDHRVLDPWVRANLCLGEEKAARDGAQKLDVIGYLDGDYRRFLSQHLKGES